MIGRRKHRPLPRLLVAVLAAAPAGCRAGPLTRAEIDAPALLRIHEALEATVASTRDDPDRRWHAGWIGNNLVNVLEGRNVGLCYHWQEIVYDGTAPAVAEVGWASTGIRRAMDRSDEHHAVVVYDPRRVAPTRLLDPDHGHEVFVLDPWRRGHEDIYRLKDWMAGRADRPELEALPYVAPDGAGTGRGE